MTTAIILGGGGFEGSHIASNLAGRSEVDVVIVADRNLLRAETVAERIGAKALAMEVDIKDHKGLVNVVKRGDIMVNVVGPFYYHGTRALEAALEAGVDYVDIVDDWDVTMSLLELDEKAKAAGITALINMGSSPGLLNVFAKHAAGLLDEVEEIKCAWGMHYVGGEGGPSAMLHAFHMMEGTVPQYIDGKWERVKPGTGRETFEFEGVPIECFYVGHAEPITLPRYIKGVNTVTNKGVILPLWVSEDMLKMVEFGMAGKEPIRIKGDTYITPIEVAMRLQALYLSERDLGPNQGGMQTKAIGVRDGERVERVYDLPSNVIAQQIELATAGPASMGALMILRGEFAEKGVSAPEAVDADRFLNQIGELGVTWRESESRMA